MSSKDIHRIGRTGRAKRRGRAITYFTQDDKPKLRSIANILRNSGCKVPDYMLTFKKQSKKVRRQLEKTIPKRADIAVENPNKKKKGKFNKKTGAANGKQSNKTNGVPKAKRSDDKSNEKKQENDSSTGKFVKLPKKRKASSSEGNSLNATKKKKKMNK